jgi:hypothetical protein
LFSGSPASDGNVTTTEGNGNEHKQEKQHTYPSYNSVIVQMCNDSPGSYVKGGPIGKWWKLCQAGPPRRK